MISPEVWLPPYTPFDHPLSPQNFFTSWPLILNHDLELCHILPVGVNISVNWENTCSADGVGVACWSRIVI